MKKFWLTSGVLFLGVAGIFGLRTLGFAEGQVSSGASGAMDSNYQKLSEEAERNRQLLEIWKDHVRTLTKERDTAYKELETLKSQQPGLITNTAHFGGIETQPLLPGGADPVKTIDNLKSQVSKLQSQLAQRSVTSVATSSSGNDSEIENYKTSIRTYQTQLKTLQEQNRQMQKEFSETREDKDVLIKDKDAALRQVDKLSKQIKSLREESGNAMSSDTDNIKIQSLEARIGSLQTSLERSQSQIEVLQTENERLKSLQSTGGPDEPQSLGQNASEIQAQLRAAQEKAEDLASEKEEALRQAREMKYQNDTLQAKLDKMKIVEKELGDTRAYLTPVIKDLQTQNDAIKKENKKLLSQSEKLQAARDALESNKSSQDESLKEATDALAKAEADADRYKAQLKKMDAENQQMRSAQAEYMKLKSEHENMRQSYEALRDSFKQQEEKITGLLGEQEDATNQIAALKSKLQVAEADVEKARVSESNIQELSSQMNELKQANASMRSAQSEQLKTIEGLRSALKANMADMQNLKTNFESYLESLVSTFDDRQKHPAQDTQDTPGS